MNTKLGFSLATRLVAPLALPVLFAACYGSAPGRPPQIPLPDLADAPDAHISVHTESKTAIENVTKHAQSCPSFRTEGDSCTDTTYTVAEPVTHTTTTAALDSQPINYAQFAVITDPKYSQKLAQVEELSHKCQRANVPRYAGIGLMLGGLLVGSLVGGDAGKGIAYGGLIGGAGSYTLGFFAFGGRDCVAARQLYDSMDFSRQVAWNTVEGQDYADKMHALAEEFNAAHGGGHASAPAAPSSPSTGDADIEIAPPPTKPATKTKKKPAKTTAATKSTSVAMRMR